MVFPAPGSSASRKRRGWRVSNRAVDGGQLVGQGLDLRRVYPDVGVEEVGKADAQRFRCEPESVPVAVEGESSRSRARNH